MSEQSAADVIAAHLSEARVLASRMRDQLAGRGESWIAQAIDNLADAIEALDAAREADNA